MNDKLTYFQEQFCLAYIKADGNASAAYRAVSPSSLKWMPKTVWEKASHMLALDKVRARIAALQDKSTQAALVTVSGLNQKLVEIMAEARDDQQYAVCVAAIMGQAKLFGFLVDKKEIRTGALDMIGAKELRAIDDAISEFSVRAKAGESQPEGAGGTTH